MLEPDDRLAGDPVWELFPAAPPKAPRSRRLRNGLALALLIVESWLLWPPLSVSLACLAAAFKDLRTGRQLKRSIPDKAGGGICALFAYAWGAWKFGVAAFVMMFAPLPLYVMLDEARDVPPAFMAALLLLLAGFTASAIFTAAGLAKAYRSGMRVWIGKGVNQARMLMLGMLIVGFTLLLLIPSTIWMVPNVPGPVRGRAMLPFLLWLGLCGISGPLILVILDRVGRSIIADKPGKFGPKVPMVGKWNS